MSIKHFRGGRYGSVYKCRICTRSTRDTGDNGSVELCPECNEWSMAENAVNDYGSSMTPEEMAAQIAFIAKMQQRAVNKGGVIHGVTKCPGAT